MESQQHASPSIRLQRHYPTAPERVWQAWTEAKALSAWFGPRSTAAQTHAEFDVRVGGHYLIRFHASDGETHQVSGTYQEVIPNRRLVFTWSWVSTPERISRISIDLKPVDDGTELTFVHDRFYDAQARDNHEKGWLTFFPQLDTYLYTHTQEA